MEALHIVYHMLSEKQRERVKQISVADMNGYYPYTGKITFTHFAVVKGKTSLAKALVAHETAHVQQNVTWYFIFKRVCVSLFLACFTIGMIWSPVLLFSSLLLLIVNWLTLIIIEANASYKAYKWLKAQKCANMKIVKKCYIDSLFTYIKPF